MRRKFLVGISVWGTLFLEDVSTEVNEPLRSGQRMPPIATTIP